MVLLKRWHRRNLRRRRSTCNWKTKEASIQWMEQGVKLKSVLISQPKTGNRVLHWSLGNGVFNYSYRNLLVFNSVYTRLIESFLNKFWKNAQKWTDNFMKWMGKPGKDFIKKINSRKSQKFRFERLEKDFISLWKILSKKKN